MRPAMDESHLVGGDDSLISLHERGRKGVTLLFTTVNIGFTRALFI